MNLFCFLITAYSRNMKETYETMEILIDHVKYREHKWLICGDFKVIGLLMGLQGGNV